MLFQIEDTTDQITLRIPEIKPLIAFHTVSTTLLIVSRTVLIVEQIAFQMLWKKSRIPSRIGVRKATIAFQIAEIFSCTQSIALPIKI